MEVDNQVGGDWVGKKLAVGSRCWKVDWSEWVVLISIRGPGGRDHSLCQLIVTK